MKKLGKGRVFVEVVQQNIMGKPRERFELYVIDNKYSVGKSRKPAGWLRQE